MSKNNGISFGTLNDDHYAGLSVDCANALINSDRYRKEIGRRAALLRLITPGSWLTLVPATRPDTNKKAILAAHKYYCKTGEIDNMVSAVRRLNR